MKRNLLTTVFCLLSVCVYSQINLGVKAGLNLANLTGDDVEDAKFRPALLAGAYLGIGLTEKFKVQPEVLFVSAGSKTSGFDSSIGQNYDQSFKLSYVSIPVMFMYKITSFLNVQAGPQISILTSAKNVIEYDKAGKIDADIKDTLKSSDFGINVGAGLDFGKFNVSARYCIGLSNINDVSDSSVKNQAIQVAVGYSIFSFGD